MPFVSRRALRVLPLDARILPAAQTYLSVVAAGATAGQPARAVLRNATTNATLLALDPYPGFRGGVRVAAGDVTGDGVPDLVTAPGPGGGPHVRVFDGTTGTEVRAFFAYDPGFRGGLSVASADLDGDGYDDIVTGAGEGGGPHVQAFSGRTGALLDSFFAYDPAFRGGVRVAVGDLDDDGRVDIVTAPGPGGGPHVKAFSGATGDVIFSRFAYDPSFAGGVYVAAGDFDADGRADIATGAGEGGGPQVRAFALDGRVLASRFVADVANRGGVRLGTVDSADGLRADIVGDAGGAVFTLSGDPWAQAAQADATVGFVAGSWAATKDPLGSKLVARPGLGYDALVGAPPPANTLAWFDWYARLLAQRQANVPSRRATTLYFSQDGNDSTGDGSYANPYRSLAEAQAILNATPAGNVRLRFRRGDVWREDGPFIVGPTNVTVDDYGDARLPKPLFSRFTLRYAGGWEFVGGTTYRRAEPQTLGFVRYAADPFGAVLFEARDAAHVATTAGSWGQEGGYLYVNAGGDPAAAGGLEACPRQDGFAVFAAGKNVRLENLRFEGFGINPTAATFGISINSDTGGDAVVKGCEVYYTGYHAFGQVSNGAGGAVTFIDCRAALCMVSNGATTFVGYAAGGGQESIFENCDSGQVLLPSYRWLGDTPAATAAGGQGVYGHSNGAPAALFVARGCDIEPAKYGAFYATTFANTPAAATLAQVRSFIVEDTAVQPNTPLIATLAPWNTAQVNCRYVGQTYNVAPIFAMGEFQGGWAYNCVYEVTATAAPSSAFAKPYNAAVQTGAVENCEVVYRGAVSSNGSAFFGAYYDAADWAGKLFRNNVFAVDVANSSSAVVSLNVSNAAGNLHANAVYQVANPANPISVPGAGAGVINDPRLVVLTSLPGTLAAPAAGSPLFDTGEANGLEFDYYRAPRGTRRTIGPVTGR